MKKGLINLLLIIAFLFALTPLLVYWWQFHKSSLSNDSQLWSNFGDYLNGTFTPVVALVGVIVTLLLGLISEKRNEANKMIEQQKSRPLLHIGYYDGESTIRLFMKNKGNGPLIITEYTLVDISTGQKYSGLWECIPKTNFLYDNYTGNQNNVVLSPDEEIELLKLSSSEDDETFQNVKRQLRQNLGELKFAVKYKDVFDTAMPPYERNLAWFKRLAEVETERG